MVFIRFLFLFFSLLFSLGVFSQSTEAVKKKQEQAKKEINYLNTLLKNAQHSETATLENLSILDEKIKKGKELVLFLTEEIDLLEYLISENRKKQSRLNADSRKMLDLYAKLVYETWKRRNNQMGKITFILSSTDFSQAYARYRYLEQIQDYSKRQIRLIKQANDSLQATNNRLAGLLLQKNDIQNRLSQQNSQLAKEINQANNIVGQLKKKQQDLAKRLSIEIENEKKYRIQLEKLIAQQINSSKNNTSGQKLSPKGKLISNDFVKNKGSLPWPVAEGFISERYGMRYNINFLPSLKDVENKNNGITITTSAKAEVMAVFDGEVARVYFFPGRNNGVLIRHGERVWTFYDNLIELYVKEGDAVKTKQKIGRLPVGKGGNSSFNFQVWNGQTHEDPSLWLSK
jgi:septal ring factor EnvC (AmiA/AmiB activator)